MKTLLFLARRFLLNVQERSIRIMLSVTFVSIMIGSGSLALVSAVMNGFQKETTRIIKGVNPDIILSKQGQPLDYQRIKEIIHKEFPGCIASMAPLAHGQAMLSNNTSTGEKVFVHVIGIEPQAEMQMDGLSRMIVDPPNAPLNTLLLANDGLIGQRLATSLELQLKDAVTLTVATDTGRPEFHVYPVRIQGIFKTGINETDTHIIFCNLTFFYRLFPSYRITQINLNLVNPKTTPTIAPIIAQRLNVTAESWKERYPALLAALTLEKYALFLVLLLITLVACMNIISLLYMFITYKKGEIAILRTMGFTARQLTRLFVIMGVLLSFLATTMGIFVAALLSFLIQHSQIISLPDVYFVSHLPAQLDLAIIISIYSIIFVISFVASYVPARTIAYLKPADVLKNHS